jgi:hypothetical protein
VDITRYPKLLCTNDRDHMYNLLRELIFTWHLCQTAFRALSKNRRKMKKARKGTKRVGKYAGGGIR